MKNKSYRLLSILLSILVLVSACICPAVVNADTANVSRGTNVVYIKTTNAGPIGQQVSVTAGETYVYTFSLSNDITPTVAVNDASSRWVSLLSNVTVTEISKDTTTSDKYTTYTYELAFSSSFSKTSAIVGIKLGGTKEGYLFNSYIYKKSDTNKTQMFVNGGFENGYLDSWIYKYMTFSAGKNALSLTNCTFAAENGTVGDTGETYLEVMAFKDTPMYETTRMLYVKSSHAGPIGQLVNLTAGETYVFSFSLSNGLTVKDIRLHHRSNRYQNLSGYTVGTPVTDTTTSDLYTTYTYEVTLDATSFTQTSALFGVRLNGTSAGGYLFNVSLYKKSDANKTEMFVNNDFSNNSLDSWVYKYMSFGNADKGLAGLKSATFAAESTALNAEGETYIEIVDIKDTVLYETTRVLYVKSSHAGPIGQLVNLTAGETYVFSFSLSNGLTVKDIRLHHRSNRYQNLSGYTVGTPVTDTTTSDLYTIYTYEVTLDATSFTQTSALFGVRLNGTSAGGYLFNVSLYKKSDANKTEMFVNNDFANNSLDSWAYKYMSFGNADKGLAGLKSATFAAESTALNAEGETYIEVMNVEDTEIYDESFMPATTPNKMVEINSNHKGPFGTQINTTAGETYTFKFGISDDLDFNVVLYDKDARYSNLNATATLKSSDDSADGYTYYEYEVVVPSTYTKDGAILGITFNGTAPYKGYFFDASAYKTSDTGKTELIANGDFADGYLNNWVWKYTNFGANGNLTEETFQEDSKDVTVKVVDFDASLMAPDTTPKMVHIETDHVGPIGQLITAEAGETYTFTFAISNNAKFDVVANDGSARYQSIGAEIEFVKGEDKGKYGIWTYEVTMPDNLTEKDNNVLLGLKLKGTAPYDCYLTNVSLYKTSDTEKTDILTNGDFMSGLLDSWRWYYINIDAGLSVYTNPAYVDNDKTYSVSLEVVPFDQSVMEAASASFPDPAPKMLHIDGDGTGPFFQQVTVEPSETYTFKFAISNNATFNVIANKSDAITSSVGAEINFVSGEDKGRYAIWTYEIKMPETILDGKKGGESETNLVLVGIQLKGTSPYDCYLTDIEFYKSTDTNKTNILKNGNFRDGYLNSWRWRYENFSSKGLSTCTSTQTEGATSKTTLLEVVKFDENVMEAVAAKFPPTGPQMVHITGAGTGPFFQQVAVEAGEKYTYEVAISNSIQFDVTVNKQSAITTPAGAEIAFVSGEDKGKYSIWTYEITMPETIMNGDTKNGEAETNIVLVGIQLKGSSSYDGYLIDASLYKNSDTKKTDMLNNSAFENGYLDGWRWRYQNYSSNKGLCDVTFTETEGATQKETTLKVMDYDESVMADATAKFPPTGPQMVHITGASTGPFFQQVAVEAGETYTYEVAISNSIKFDVIANKQSAITTPVGAEIAFVSGEDKGKYSIWTYEITMPETIMNGDTKKGEKETNIVLVGIQLKGSSSYDGYLIDASLYKKSDTAKTEMLNNGDFANGCLDYWRWRYQNYSSNKGIWNVTFTETEGVTDKQTTLEVMDFDETKMADASANFPPTGPQMLHITGNHVGPIGQLVSAKAGETYTFTFAISNNASFDVAVNDGDKRHVAVSGTNITYVSAEEKGRYTIWTYKITMPEELSSKTVLLGIKLKGAKPYDCYLADVVLYKTSDETKKNLFTNGDFAIGALDSWNWKYQRDTAGQRVYEKEFTDGEDSNGNPISYKIKLEVMDFDESKMQDVKATLPDYSKKMIYFRNGALTQPFSAWVDAAPGKKFIISYSIYSTEEVLPHFNANGLRGNISNAAELLSEVKHDNYTTYTYRMTVPETYEDNLIFLGFRMPFYSEGYIFDIECYEEGDTTKKSAWKNGEFVYGFNEWIWGWTVTWFTQEGNQLKEWSDEVQQIKIVPYDLSQIDALIAEINRDDGEWWKPTDIIENEDDEVGVATVKGTFTDQNGTPLANVKLILKSTDNTYTTFTNAKGEFTFKDVIADYYELYYVNSEGEEILTSFAYTLKNGDTATLKVVSDTTKLSEVAVSTLKGTVYTASLEIVPNLKVYLRGFGETVTDKDGNFTFADVPVGKYELYTILEDGSEYVFRTVEIKENVDLAVKLKYAPETVTDSQSGAIASYWIWIIIGCGVVVLAAAGVIVFIILKKKRKAIEE